MKLVYALFWFLSCSLLSYKCTHKIHSLVGALQRNNDSPTYYCTQVIDYSEFVHMTRSLGTIWARLHAFNVPDRD